MTTSRTSRRAALGLLGAVPLAAGGLLGVRALTGTDQTPTDARPGHELGQLPRGLRPGGSLDKLVARMAAADQYSGTLLLLHQGRTVLSRSYGMANKELGIRNSADTIFAVGSLSKMFTGIAISQLVQQGKVAYHETLGTYLDGFPAHLAKAVTVHQLLTHTAGTGDIFNDNEAAMVRWTSEKEAIAGQLEIVRKQPLQFTPGSAYQYSNSGYIILSFIIAAASGQTYYDYVRQHIFHAVGMKDSDFYNRDQWRSNRRIARPYAPLPSAQPRTGPAAGGRQRLNSAPVPPSGPRVDNVSRVPFIGTGAGDAHSTAADLATFASALMGDKLLDAQHTWLATTPKFPVPPMPPPPGKRPIFLFSCYGPGATLANNHWSLGHNGGNSNGVSTDLEWFPDLGYTYVNLGNYELFSSQPIDQEARERITDS